jgi:hypothetical protein
VAPKSIQNHRKFEFGTVVRTVKNALFTFAAHGQISGRGQRHPSRNSNSTTSLSVPHCGAFRKTRINA